ncbi:DUF6584 family protein [Hamadaea sp. NPDC051192]|uniref:DUF6584 family protein n=1 Tax=Hamadaea sp. NPDC051192 TaxID=3154940 RepID=UPI0034236B71
MPKAPVLDKVAVDLARGHTQPAIQRLSSLVNAYPHDLDLRHRLAAVHRMTGNAVEAGRWDYLNPTAEPAETAAFERAFPSAPRRLAALRWHGTADLAPTEHARRRLVELTEAAAEEVPAPAEERPHRHRFLTAAALIAGAVVVVALAVLGAVTILQIF